MPPRLILSLFFFFEQKQTWMPSNASRACLKCLYPNKCSMKNRLNWKVWSVPGTVTSSALMRLGAGWNAGMEGCRPGRWGVGVALCAGERFGCTACAVSDGVCGQPAYMHAKGVMKHSPSKFFPFFSSEPWNRRDGIADTLGACHRRAISSVMIHFFKLHCSAYQHLHWQCHQEQCRIIMCFCAWKIL